MFDLPEIETLLRAELALLPTHAVRQPGGRALLLRPGAAAQSLPADTRQLRPTSLHADGDILRGDVVCAPGALPWEDESFQLVFAQHVGDVLPDSGLVEELARVMAPGSLLLWFGFNPWSPWLAWMHWRTRGGDSVPQTRHADSVRRRMQRSQLATVALDYMGSCWPRANAAPVVQDGAPRHQWLAPLRGSYLLTARKQRAVLTPLRPRAQRTNIALGARFAGTPSQRACA